MKTTSNKVELIGYYGGDLEHSLSAWTSTNRDLTDNKRNRIPSLLDMLASNGHETPFEKSSLHFLITTDIATHIQVIKHRIGVSVNAECLTGDNIITFLNTYNQTTKKLKISLEDLYKKWTNGRHHQNTEKDLIYSKNRIKKMKIRVLNENTGKFEYSHIKDIYCSGEKEIFKITLENGKFLKCSANHRILTNKGWNTLNDSLKLNDEVAVNGLAIEVINKPWTFKEFFLGSENYTRKDFAAYKNIKYELCKKWGYIHNITFKIDENKDFKKGDNPWNKNKTGYKIDIKDRKHNPYKGNKSNFWRGGVSTDRELIGVWTGQQAKKVHQKYNFTCQCCGESSGILHAHHIIPVAQDITKAKDFNNLITVCLKCHTDIHKSVESENAFAKKVLSIDFTPFEYSKKIGLNKIPRVLKVHYSKIVNIEYIGIEKTYDIEIEGEFKNFIANGIVVHNSARYKELKDDKYYIPDDWDLDEQLALINHCEDSLKKYHECLKSLKLKGYSTKRAKETARFYLPYANQITSDVMFNFRSFVNFQRLRNSEHAQKEIRDLAQSMLDLVKNIEGNPFEYSLRGFGL